MHTLLHPEVGINNKFRCDHCWNPRMVRIKQSNVSRKIYEKRYDELQTCRLVNFIDYVKDSIRTDIIKFYEPWHVSYNLIEIREIFPCNQVIEKRLWGHLRSWDWNLCRHFKWSCEFYKFSFQFLHMGVISAYLLWWLINGTLIHSFTVENVMLSA